MNKKLRNLTDSKTGIFLFMLLLFAAVSFLVGYFLLGGSDIGFLLEIIAGAEAFITLILFIVYVVERRKAQRRLEDYIESVTNDSESAKNNTLMNFPMPIAVFRMEDTRIVWANDAFFQACGEKGSHLDAKISDVVPEFSSKWLSEGKKQYPSLLMLEGRKYRVHGNVIRTENTSHKQENVVFMGITYWIDITEYDDIRIEYEESRPVPGVIIIDNYEELIRNLTDREKNRVRDSIEDVLNEWAAKYTGLLRRYERDRYIAVFEKRNLAAMKEDKFPLLESIHSITGSSGIASSLSIGFGEDAQHFSEALQFADMAVELALTRGGDQVVVKNKLSFEFFGGRGGEIEKRTKVKSRVMANAILELVRDSSKVYVMGHRYSDLDSIGAAVGVCILARQNDMKYFIVAEEENSGASQLIAKMKQLPEYRNAFISPEDAVLHADGRTLLVVVDTNRPEQVEEPDLLDACNRVAVIDHHRVAATYIHNAALGFIEPYASSACELMTEVLQEVADAGSVMQEEAEALLAGIVLDTKNFTIRTGERTFDAGAFLRRAGADTVNVKKLLQSDLEDTIAKYKILQNAQLYKNVAVAVVAEPTERIIAAKAADEMLNISGVEASIVLAPFPLGGCFASARSIGEMNMQILMEKLGGGGNRSAAAAQLRDVGLDEAKEMLHRAIDEYQNSEA